MYWDIAVSIKENKTKYSAIDKLERDYRDLEMFPEIKKELTPLYEAWKAVLNAYEKVDY